MRLFLYATAGRGPHEMGCCSRLRQRGSRRRRELDQPMAPLAHGPDSDLLAVATVQNSLSATTAGVGTITAASQTRVIKGSAGTAMGSAGGVASPNGGRTAGTGGRLVATRPATSSYRNGRRQRGRRVERWSNGRLMRHSPEDSREDRVQRALEQMSQLLQAEPQPPVHMLRAALIRYSQFASAPDVADTWLALQSRLQHLEARPEHVVQSQRKQDRAEQVTLVTWTSIFTRLGPFMGERSPRPDVAFQSDQRAPSASTTLKHTGLISVTPTSAVDTVQSTPATPVVASLNLALDVPYDRVPAGNAAWSVACYSMAFVSFEEFCFWWK